MATIGRHDAVTELANGWRLSGPIGWVSWLGLHLVYLMGFRNRINVFVDWSWNYLTYDRASRILPRVGPGTLTACPRAAPAPCPRPHGRARPAHRARRRRPRRRARPADRRRRPERRRQVDAAAGARRARCRSSVARVERTPPTATVGYLPQEPSRSDVETVAMYLARRTGVHDGHAPSWRRRRPRWPPTSTAPATATPSPSTAGCRSAAPTSTPRVGQVWADLGPRRRGCWSSRRRRCPAARRRGPGWPPCCSPASTCSCSTSRPTTSTSTASTASSGGSPSCELPVVLVSHDRTFLARTVTHVVELDEFTHRAAHYGGGWQAYLDEREVGPPGGVGALRGLRHAAAHRWPGGPSASGSGHRRACRRRASPTSRTRTSAPSRSTRPSSSPAGRRAPSGRWSGWRRSTSRASRGSCGCRLPSPGPQRRRRRPPRRRGRRAAASFTARADRPRSSAPVSGSRSSAPTARARRR